MRTRAPRSTRPAHRRTAAAAALLMLSAGLAACTSSGTTSGDAQDAPQDAPGASQAVEVDPVRLTTSFTDPQANRFFSIPGQHKFILSVLPERHLLDKQCCAGIVDKKDFFMGLLRRFFLRFVMSVAQKEPP